MAEEQDNLLLHLLREIRAEGLETRADLGQRMTRMERKFEELQEATVAAVGWAGFAKASSDHHGETMDTVRHELEELRARIAALEAKA